MKSPAQPAAARIYDYLLGGKDNYAVRWRRDTTTPTRLKIAGAVGRKP
jgi:S-adenosyl methyltransferase